jgi:hypothetical protein
MMSRRRRVCVQLVRRGAAARLHTACGVELRAGRWRQTGCWLKRGQPRRRHHTLRRRDAAIFRSSAARPLRPRRAARRTGTCSACAGGLAGGVRCLVPETTTPLLGALIVLWAARTLRVRALGFVGDRVARLAQRLQERRVLSEICVRLAYRVRVSADSAHANP